MSRSPIGARYFTMKRATWRVRVSRGACALLPSAMAPLAARGAPPRRGPRRHRSRAGGDRAVSPEPAPRGVAHAPKGITIFPSDLRGQARRRVRPRAVAISHARARTRAQRAAGKRVDRGAAQALEGRAQRAEGERSEKS